TRAPLELTVTGPHLLSRTLLDHHYADPGRLALALARIFASQLREIDADVIQLDEANIPGHPEDAEWALPAINLALDAVRGKSAVHLCFGNYGGQTIQKGTWKLLLDFMNGLHVDHVVLEMARRDPAEIHFLRGLDTKIGIGLGVIDVKTTIVET